MSQLNLVNYVTKFNETTDLGYIDINSNCVILVGPNARHKLQYIIKLITKKRVGKVLISEDGNIEIEIKGV